MKVGRTNIDTGTRLVMDYEGKKEGRTYVQPGAPMGTVVADILKACGSRGGGSSSCVS